MAKQYDKDFQDSLGAAVEESGFSYIQSGLNPYRLSGPIATPLPSKLAVPEGPERFSNIQSGLNPYRLSGPIATPPALEPIVPLNAPPPSKLAVPEGPEGFSNIQSGLNPYRLGGPPSPPRVFNDFPLGGGARAIEVDAHGTYDPYGDPTNPPSNSNPDLGGLTSPTREMSAFAKGKAAAIDFGGRMKDALPGAVGGIDGIDIFRALPTIPGLTSGLGAAKFLPKSFIRNSIENGPIPTTAEALDGVGATVVGGAKNIAGLATEFGLRGLDSAKDLAANQAWGPDSDNRLPDPGTAEIIGADGKPVTEQAPEAQAPEAQATAAKAAAVKGKAADEAPEATAEVKTLTAKYMKTDESKGQALTYADQEGLAVGGTDEERVQAAVKDRLTKRADRQAWVASGGPGRAYAQANGLMKEAVFRAQREGGNIAGREAATRYQNGQQALTGLIRKYGPEVDKMLANPEAFKESNPAAYNAMSPALGLLTGGGTAPVTPTERMEATLNKGGAGLKGGDKMIFQSTQQLKQMYDAATVAGALPAGLDARVGKALTALNEVRGGSPGSNGARIRKEVLQPLYSELAAQSRLTPAKREQQRKNAVTLIAARKAADAKQYQDRRVNIATFLAKSGAAKGNKLSNADAFKQMNILSENISNPETTVKAFEVAWNKNVEDGVADPIKAALRAVPGITPDEKMFIRLRLQALSSIANK